MVVEHVCFLYHLIFRQSTVNTRKFGLIYDSISNNLVELNAYYLIHFKIKSFGFLKRA